MGYRANVLNKVLPPAEIFRNCRKAVPALRVEPLTERLKRLTALRSWIVQNRSAIHQAVHADFCKPAMETDLTEIFHVLNEIKVARRSLERWAAPSSVNAPLYLPGTRAWIEYEPRGVCLIIAPWNYPFTLAAGPLVSALAAGNSVVIKPSEITPTVSALIKKMCDELFDPSVVAVCEGGVTIAQALLAQPFDHIFFTGSPTVGKVVMKAAAEHLTSVTLELGGKSPALVSSTAKLNDAAERIAVAKFLNNGQTCIAPDYVLADKAIAGELVERLIQTTKKMYSPGVEFEHAEDYGRIINESHFIRIEALLQNAIDDGAKIAWQGKRDKTARFMHPVILTEVPLGSRIMTEEIFGPVLPVIAYDTLDDALTIVNSLPKPLAFYVFTSDESTRIKAVKQTSAGTMCINDCAVQFLHHELPFGGVNNSGIGKAHGYHGFLAFSNEKPVLKQKSGYNGVKTFYPPFTKRTKQLMDWFLKLF